MAAAADRADRDDAAVGGRVVHQAGAFTVIPGGGHEHDALAQCVGDRRPLGGAAAGRGRIPVPGQSERPRIERQVDDPRPVVDRVGNASGDGTGQPPGHGLVRIERIVELQVHPDRQDSRGGRDPGNACLAAGAVPVAGDEARHRRSVDAPVRSAGLAAGTGVVGSGDHVAGQVRVAGGDTGAEHGDGDAGAPRRPPRRSDVQAGQPPLLGAGRVTRQRAAGPCAGAESGRGPGDAHACDDAENGDDRN
jgi:hypothetical protein